MLFTISTKSFIEALRLVKPAVDRKSTLPILSYVQIEASDGQLRLTADKLDARASLTLDAAPGYESRPGATCVDLQAIEKLLAKLDKAGVVTLEQDPSPESLGHLNLTIGKIKASLPTLPAEEFPGEQTQGASNGQITLDPKELHRALTRTQTAASDDIDRPVLNSVLIENKKSIVTLCAVDGFRLHLASLPTECPALEFRWVFPSLALKLLDNFLVRTEGKVYFEAFTETDEDEDDRTTLKITADNWSLIIPLIPGRFPDYEVFVPRQANYVLTVNRKEFIEAVTTLQSIRGDQVKLTMDHGLTLATAQEEGGSIETKLEASDIHGPGELTFGANPGYLLDALKAQEGDTVMLNANTSKSPFVLTDPADDSYRQVVMPLWID